MKLSFSISSKSSSSSRSNSTKTPQSFAAHPAEDGEPQPQFVTVFDPSKSLSDAPARRVIPPIPNADRRPVKKMKNLIPPPSSDDPVPASETHFVLDTTSADPAAIPYGLTLRSNSATVADSDPNPQDQERGERRYDKAEEAKNRYIEDMSNLPDDRGSDEFADISIEDWASAYLAGYGWSEGKGIGRNNKVGDTKVVQYERRADTAGLGYVPSPNDPKRKKMQAKMQAMDHDKKKPDSRQLDSEKIVRVISGRHAGQKGKVVERSGKKIMLKLLQSSEKVQVGEDMVAKLGSVAEEKCLKKLKELEFRDRDERKEERRSRDSGREEKSSRDGRRDERRYRDEEAKPVEKSSGDGGGDRWLTSHIKVRIISRDIRGGKIYKQKGEVVDVVGLRTCDITMDGSGELVQGVDQKMLETALPKRGGSVLVLYGKHKGVFGSLMERDMEEETGVVRDADSHALINVRLDQIAEYVGDPSYLGY